MPQARSCQNIQLVTRRSISSRWRWQKTRRKGSQMASSDVRRDGAVGQRDGSVRWRVWAPQARQVELVLIENDQRRAMAMEREECGFFHHTEAKVPEGQRYA